MAHIWSDDLVSGSVSNGAWELQRPVNGQRDIIHHFFDEQDIPWIWVGVNTLVVEPTELGGDFLTVTFPELSANRDDASVATAIEDAFNTGLVPAPGTTVTVVYDADTLEFVLTFTMTTGLLWAHGSTTAHVVFNETANQTPALEQRISARYVTSRPHSLELTIVQASQTQAHSRDTGAHVIMPLNDYQLSNFQVDISNAKTLDISWARLNAPNSTCPFNNEWELTIQ